MVAIGNDKLEWQGNEKSNGFDLEVFNGILTIKGDYYINTTDNLLSENQLPLSSGFRLIRRILVRWKIVGSN